MISSSIDFIVASQETSMKDTDLKLLEASKTGDFHMIQVRRHLLFLFFHM